MKEYEREGAGIDARTKRRNKKRKSRDGCREQKQESESCPGSIRKRKSTLVQRLPILHP